MFKERERQDKRPPRPEFKKGSIYQKSILERLRNIGQSYADEGPLVIYTGQRWVPLGSPEGKDVLQTVADAV